LIEDGMCSYQPKGTGLNTWQRQPKAKKLVLSIERGEVETLPASKKKRMLASKKLPQDRGGLIRLGVGGKKSQWKEGNFKGRISEHSPDLGTRGPGERGARQSWGGDCGELWWKKKIKKPEIRRGGPKDIRKKGKISKKREGKKETKKGSIAETKSVVITNSQLKNQRGTWN